MDRSFKNFDNFSKKGPRKEIAEKNLTTITVLTDQIRRLCFAKGSGRNPIIPGIRDFRDGDFHSDWDKLSRITNGICYGDKF